MGSLQIRRVYEPMVADLYLNPRLSLIPTASEYVATENGLLNCFLRPWKSIKELPLAPTHSHALNKLCQANYSSVE